MHRRSCCAAELKTSSLGKWPPVVPPLLPGVLCFPATHVGYPREDRPLSRDRASASQTQAKRPFPSFINPFPASSTFHALPSRREFPSARSEYYYPCPRATRTKQTPAAPLKVFPTPLPRTCLPPVINHPLSPLKFFLSRSALYLRLAPSENRAQCSTVHALRPRRHRGRGERSNDARAFLIGEVPFRVR